MRPWHSFCACSGNRDAEVSVWMLNWLWCCQYQSTHTQWSYCVGKVLEEQNRPSSSDLPIATACQCCGIRRLMRNWGNPCPNDQQPQDEGKRPTFVLWVLNFQLCKQKCFLFVCGKSAKLRWSCLESGRGDGGIALRCRQSPLINSK